MQGKLQHPLAGELKSSTTHASKTVSHCQSFLHKATITLPQSRLAIWSSTFAIETDEWMGRAPLHSIHRVSTILWADMFTRYALLTSDTH